jgi:hypothetical protein
MANSAPRVLVATSSFRMATERSRGPMDAAPCLLSIKSRSDKSARQSPSRSSSSYSDSVGAAGEWQAQALRALQAHMQQVQNITWLLDGHYAGAIRAAPFSPPSEHATTPPPPGYCS